MASSNQSIQRILQTKQVQPKLIVNPPNDEYELEADRIADSLTQTPKSLRAINDGSREKEGRKIQDDPLSQKITPLVQRQKETKKEDEEKKDQPATLTVQPQLLVQRDTVKEEPKKDEEDRRLQTKSLFDSSHYLVQRTTETKKDDEEKRIQTGWISGQSTFLIQKDTASKEEDEKKVQSKSLTEGSSDYLVQRQKEARKEDEEKQVQPATLTVQPQLLVQRDTVKEEPKKDEEDRRLQTKSLFNLSPYQVQRTIETKKDDEEKRIQTGWISGQSAFLIQKETASKEEDEKKVQSKSLNERSAALIQTESVISSMAGNGSPLDAHSLEFFESSLGHDLSQVRIFTDSASSKAARELNAAAFTQGNNIFFGEGRYQPATREGQKLLAHELVHTIQQRPKSLAVAPSRIQVRSMDVVQPSLRIQRGVLDTITGAVGSVIDKASDLVGAAKDSLLEFLKGFASGMPGYPLLSAILGRDPITDKPVERSPVNILRGILDLAGASEKFDDLMKTGSIEKAYAWFNEQIEALNLNWSTIKALFKQAWDSLDKTDIFSPSKAWNKIKNVFGPPLVRLKNFAIAAGKKVLEFIIEGALTLAGGAGIIAAIKKGQSAFTAIAKNPPGFLGNLVRAIQQGLKQFVGNILNHLKTGLFEWLFGSLASAGLQVPTGFDFKGILSLILQVLGLTYSQLRPKFVALIGEKPVAFLETAFGPLKTLVMEGPAAAWKEIMQYASDLKDTVINSIRDWVATTIIQNGIAKLVSMINPVVGGIIQIASGIYQTAMFFKERAAQIAAVGSAVLDSLSSIAAGNVGGAASYVERSLAKLVPVVISFAARLIGLGGISEKIRSIIGMIQGKVHGAIDKVGKAIIGGAKNLLAKMGVGKKEKEGEDDKVEGDVRGQARKMLLHRLESEQSKLEIDAILSQVLDQLRTHGLKSLTLGPENEEGEQQVLAEASPSEPLFKLAPKKASVTMVATLKLNDERPELDSIKNFNQFLPRTVVDNDTGKPKTVEAANLPLVESGNRNAGQYMSGGVILKPRSGSKEIKTVSWNTGVRISGSNASHAERQFTHWIDGQSSIWRRIENINVFISKSPCSLCAIDLCNILTRIRSKSSDPTSKPSASLRYIALHTGKNPTTSGDISSLMGCGWLPTSGPAPKGEQKLEADKK